MSSGKQGLLLSGPCCQLPSELTGLTQLLPALSSCSCQLLWSPLLLLLLLLQICQLLLLLLLLLPLLLLLQQLSMGRRNLSQGLTGLARCW
jgi:Zn-dependent protease